jgi:2-methylcitrate dehydratase PrpD
VSAHILDQVGIQLACADLPSVSIVSRYAARYGAEGQATVVGTNLRLDPEPASLANGMSGSGFEMDDYLSGTMGHPGCVVVPASLAAAEEAGTSGAEFLLACCLGFELVVRIARGTMPSLLHQRGFHMTSIHGVFAAAAAAGRLAHLDAPTMLMALGIAGSHACGTTEYARTGGEVKRMHAGMASAAGVRAARLASLGLTAPPTTLEGPRGVLQAFCPDPKPGLIAEDLGERWLLLDHLSIKRYCSAGGFHAAIDGILSMMVGHDLQYSDIAAVEIGASTQLLGHLGSIGPHPTDMLEAQFSTQFSLALTIVNRANTFQTYLDAERAGFADPAVLDIAERVRLVPDSEVQGALPLALGKVTMRTHDGQQFSYRGYAKGSRANPVSFEEVAEKFRANAVRAVAKPVSDAIEKLVNNLEDATDVAELSNLLQVRR